MSVVRSDAATVTVEPPCQVEYDVQNFQGGVKPSVAWRSPTFEDVNSASSCESLGYSVVVEFTGKSTEFGSDGCVIDGVVIGNDGTSGIVSVDPMGEIYTNPLNPAAGDCSAITEGWVQLFITGQGANSNKWYWSSGKIDVNVTPAVE